MGCELSKSKTYLSPVANMDSSSSLTLAVISGPMALASMLMQVNTEGSTTHDRVFLNTTHTHTLSATSGEHQGVNHPHTANTQYTVTNIQQTHTTQSPTYSKHIIQSQKHLQHQVNTPHTQQHPENTPHTVSNISYSTI